MHVNYEEVGKRIALRRKALGLKQSEVNERAELSDKYLSHIETARTIPSIDVLMKICLVLETTPDYILLGAINANIDTRINQSVKLVKGKFRQEFLLNCIEWLIRQDI